MSAVTKLDGHPHLFALDLLSLTWRCRCGLGMPDEAMPR